MFATTIISLREGIEAFLIVAICIAYLRKTNRSNLLPAVWWGIATAIVASVGTGLAFGQADNKPLWEGLLAAVAAVSVASLTVYMWRAGKRMRTEIGARLESESAKGGRAAWIGVFLFVLLMITREGMETALLISVQLFEKDSSDIVAGAIVGTGLAALIAWAWSRYGHRVNLARFLQVTSAFLMLFSIQLLIYAFHEFTEAGVLPINNAYWHLASEPYGPEGEYGHWLSYGLVLVPLAWLAIAALKDRMQARTPRLA
jgi:high-affinity iron transporter